VSVSENELRPCCNRRNAPRRGYACGSGHGICAPCGCFRSGAGPGRAQACSSRQDGELSMRSISGTRRDGWADVRAARRDNDRLDRQAGGWPCGERGRCSLTDGSLWSAVYYASRASSPSPLDKRTNTASPNASNHGMASQAKPCPSQEVPVRPSTPNSATRTLPPRENERQSPLNL